ncbi:hypothetical protein ANN_22647 [Periplaneta americana]|uniref:Uncharacterized protein n=1 Tax=Periplaneta americana TaxID=6978 RepID=A0ABQ8S9K2_PERAM|nr:hypothetical protein ANN_22647 [Periplaneta americana]
MKCGIPLFSFEIMPYGERKECYNPSRDDKELEAWIRGIITNAPRNFLQNSVDSITGRLRKLVEATVVLSRTFWNHLESEFEIKEYEKKNRELDPHKPQLKVLRVQFKVCHGSLYAVMWLVVEPREFNLPTLPQRRITYVSEKLPSKYSVHSE